MINPKGINRKKVSAFCFAHYKKGLYEPVRKIE